MPVPNPAGQPLGDRQPCHGIVVLHDAARFPSCHIDFVVWQHRLEQGMRDEHGNRFYDESFELLGPEIGRGITAAHEYGVDDAVTKKKLPLGRAIGPIADKGPDGRGIVLPHVADPDD